MPTSTLTGKGQLTACRKRFGTGSGCMREIAWSSESRVRVRWSSRPEPWIFGSGRPSGAILPFDGCPTMPGRVSGALGAADSRGG